MIAAHSAQMIGVPGGAKAQQPHKRPITTLQQKQDPCDGKLNFVTYTNLARDQSFDLAAAQLSSKPSGNTTPRDARVAIVSKFASGMTKEGRTLQTEELAFLR